MNSDGFARQSSQARILGTLVFGLCLSLTGSARGQSVPTVPDYTGDRVYLVGGPKGIDAQSLKREIGRIEQSSRQTYFVIAVRNTGPGADSTKKFMDKLADTWPDQAKKKGVPFDVKRVVVIVLGVENRKIVILGGTELQQKFAFRDSNIDRELVRPYFTPIAQKGDLTQGLRVLMEQTDRWIAARDKEQALRQSEIAARSLQLRKEAESAIAETRKELAETQALLKSRHDEGMTVTDLDARVEQLKGRIDTAAADLVENPAQALDVAKQTNRGLLETAEQIRRIPVLRTELDVRLGKTMETFAEIAAAIDTARKAGIATTRQEESLDVGRTRLDEAKALIAKDPLKAEKLVNEGEGLLQDILTEVRELPRAQAELASTKTEAEKSIAEATSLIADARRKGVKLNDAATAIKDFEAGAIKLTKLSQEDPIALRAAFRDTAAAAETVRKVLPPKIARHQLLNRTLPSAVLAGIGAVGVGIGGLAWRARRKYQREVTAQFEQYRTRAVALMDKLDGLRKEHESLMKLDPDFTEPSTGRTLAVYREVEADLNGLWDKWLQLMDVWERADKLVRSASSLNSEQITRAKALLETEGSFEGIDELVESARKRLDDLGQAHENVRKVVARAAEAVSKTESKIAALTARNVRLTSESNALASVGQVLDEAKGLIVADPIGAGEIVARAEATLSEITTRAERLAGLTQKAETLAGKISAIAAETSQLRRDGLLLQEPEADPDPKLARAAKMAEVASNDLHKPDADAAERILGEIETILTATESDTKRHQDARNASIRAIPEARQALAAAETAIRENSDLFDRMTAEYAPGSFATVADNIGNAEKLAASALSLIEKAAEEASDEKQHYLAAMAKLAQAGDAIVKVNAATKAVGDRNEALATIAANFRTAFADSKNAEQAAVSLFSKSREIVSDESRKSLDQAMTIVRRVEEVAGQDRPDWPEAERLLQAARRAIDLATKQAQEDIAGYEKLKAREDQVRQRIESVGRLLEKGDKDRPPANQRFRQARDLFSRYESTGADMSYGWDEKLRWLDEIASNTDRAEELANQDINLANGAAAEIDSAARALRTSQAYYGSGVSAEMSRAESLLTEARNHLASQAYELAVESAQAAEHAASVALNKAEHAARKRRMQADRTIVLGDPMVMGGLFDVLARAGAEIARHSANHGGKGNSGGSWTSGGSSSPWSSGDSGGSSWGSGSSSSSWGGGGDSSSGGSWSSGSSQSSW
jgi:uncharacterized membrane protein YgcG